MNDFNAKKYRIEATMNEPVCTIRLLTCTMRNGSLTWELL